MNFIKSKQRVTDHGEVFTPAWMVEAMLDLVKDETQRIDSRFLEPACGSGNFLAQVLRRKLAAVELKYCRSDFERRHYALSAEGSLFAHLGKHDIFMPAKTWPPMTLGDLAAGSALKAPAQPPKEAA